MGFVPLRRARLNQPNDGGQIDFSHPVAEKILDAWLPHSLTSRSAMGRKPTYVAPGGIGLAAGKFGVGAFGKNGSVRYDVGAFGESGTFAFLAIVIFLNYASTLSVVRRNGAFIPVQVANAGVRGVGWSPVATADEYYTVPSGERSAVLVANRISQSTQKLYRDGALVNTDSSFTGYGSTANPLCFLGTEADGEIFTATGGLFFGGIAFKEFLTDAELLALTANPWQVFL